MNLYVDADTHDLVIADGDILTVDGAADIAQAVRVTLQAWIGDWELDTRHGTDYPRILADDGVADTEIREILSAAIYQEPTVKRIDMLDIARSDRVVTVRFTAQLVDGSMISGEVNSDG
ncbi:MAG: hypothetical protein MRZ67_07695 [Christensenella sp.]|jgi:hypothetical protein|nr:hypothetical protein [Christensenella sp.]